jgi:glycosyltransferase involved in cell wall biosynthesis
MGWEVTVLALVSTAVSPRPDVETLGFFGKARSRRFDPAIAGALRRRVRVFSPDVVLANGGPTLRYCVVANLGLPFSLVYAAIGEPRYWIRSPLSGLVNRVLLRQVDRILAVSEETRTQLLHLEPALDGRIEVAYTGVPDRFFSVQGKPPGPALRVVFMGSLSREKDPLKALRVAAAVPGVELRFVGDGPLGETLRLEAASLGVEDRVSFVGSVNEVTPHLAWADVLLLTSLTEGVPGAILEAGAAGRAIVTVDVGGVREAVVDGVTGLVVGPEDEDGLVAALRLLAEDRERLSEMGRAARTHISDHFTLERTIEEYARLLSESIR